MSDLTNAEKRRFERLLGMASGYVLDFSNRTFEEFVKDTVGRNIFDSKYDYGSGSKANRLRAFWQAEPNYVVGKLMTALVDYEKELEDRNQLSGSPNLMRTGEELRRAVSLREECRQTVERLLRPQPVSEVEALAARGFSQWDVRNMLPRKCFCRLS